MSGPGFPRTRSRGEVVFSVGNVVILCLLSVVTVYPFLYVVFGSLSDPAALVRANGVLLAPAGLTLDGYRMVFRNPMIVIGYRNTLMYVVGGTLLSLLATGTFAYALSRRGVYWRNLIMFLVTFSMLFDGGLIPLYIIVRNLGLINTRWSIVLPVLVSTWNLIIMRTSFMGIPFELEEAARIDGANDIVIFSRVIVPLSKPVISVIALFYAVDFWNTWVNASIFLKDQSLHPLQLVLRDILVVGSTVSMTSGSGASGAAQSQALTIVIQYAAIVVTTVPILFIYPFIQKYFTQGVMMGAIKG